ALDWEQHVLVGDAHSGDRHAEKDHGRHRINGQHEEKPLQSFTRAPSRAERTMASSTATLCTSSPPGSAIGRRAIAARAKCSSSACSVLAFGKLSTSGRCFFSTSFGSMKQAFIVQVCRCSTSPTSTQPFEPKICKRQV